MKNITKFIKRYKALKKVDDKLQMIFTLKCWCKDWFITNKEFSLLNMSVRFLFKFFGFFSLKRSWFLWQTLTFVWNYK